MRGAAAAVLAVGAVGSAVYFASLRLDSHGNYPACLKTFQFDCGPSSRGFWQFLVAILIAALGWAGTVLVLNGVDKGGTVIGRAARGALVVLLWGLCVGVVGLAVGVIVGGATANQSDSWSGLYVAGVMFLGALIGFAAGALARLLWIVRCARRCSNPRDLGFDQRIGVIRRSVGKTTQQTRQATNRPGGYGSGYHVPPAAGTRGMRSEGTELLYGKRRR